MAVQTYAAGADLFTNVYFPGLVDQLHTATPELGLIAKSGRSQWSGRSVVLGSRTGRNRSYRPTSSARNSAAFPTTGRQTFDNFTIPAVVIHGSGGIEAFASAASQGSESAFADALKSEVQGHLLDMKKDKAIDFYCTPLGILGRLSDDPGGGAVFTLEQDSTQLAHWRGNGNRYLSVGQEVEIISQDGVTRRLDDDTGTAFTISAVASANRTQFTTDDNASAGVSVGDLVLRSGTHGAQADPGDNTEAALSWNGLEQLFANTNVDIPARGVSLNFELDVLQGVDRATAAGDYANAVTIDMDSNVLTRNTLNQGIKLGQYASGDYPDVLLCEGAVQLAIVDLMVGDQRYQPQKFPGGFQADALLWNAGNADVPVLGTRDCPYDRIYAFNTSGGIEQFVLQEMELIETDGSILRQDAAGGDVWNYNWREFSNLGSRQPNCGVKFTRVGGADESYGAGAGRHYAF